jgi:hypothetical protein
MDVFLGWSGERSSSLAKLLYDWLPDVVQAVEPWLSEHDIEAGAQWTPELMTKLQVVRFAIVCVTAENRESSWLHFEAGLVAKAITTNRVCPVLLGLTQADITGPLTIFQMKEVADRGDMLSLAHAVNNNLEKPRTELKVQTAFDAFWDRLQVGLEEIGPPPQVPRKRDPLEVAEETLLLLREQNKVVAEQSAALSRIEDSAKKELAMIGSYPITFTPSKPISLDFDSNWRDILTYRSPVDDAAASARKKILAPETRPKKN